MLEFNPMEHSKVAVKNGGSVKVFCTTTNKIKECQFKGPQGLYIMKRKGQTFHNNRMENYMLSDHQCGLQIHILGRIDEGMWECRLLIDKLFGLEQKQFELKIIGNKLLVPMFKAHIQLMYWKVLPKIG